MHWLIFELDKHAAALQGAASFLASLAALCAVIVTLRTTSRQLRETIRIANEQIAVAAENSKRQFENAERQLEASIESNERQFEIAEQQIAATVESNQQQFENAQRQFENADRQLDNAERQLKATTISDKRQDWINKVRDEIAVALSSLYGMYTHVAHNSTEEQRRTIVNRLDLAVAKLQLFLNPAEKNQADLINKLLHIPQVVAGFVTTGQTEPSAIANHSDEIVKLSQSVLKQEWERVKNLE